MRQNHTVDIFHVFPPIFDRRLLLFVLPFCLCLVISSFHFEEKCEHELWVDTGVKIFGTCEATLYDARPQNPLVQYCLYCHGF